jgi:hypothetical protein
VAANNRHRSRFAARQQPSSRGLGPIAAWSRAIGRYLALRDDALEPVWSDKRLVQSLPLLLWSRTALLSVQLRLKQPVIASRDAVFTLRRTEGRLSAGTA